MDAMYAWQIPYCACLALGVLLAPLVLRKTKRPAQAAGLLLLAGACLWSASYGLGSLYLGAGGIVSGAVLFGLAGSLCAFTGISVAAKIPGQLDVSGARAEALSELHVTFAFVGYTVLDILTAQAGGSAMAASPATLGDLVASRPGLYLTLFDQNLLPADPVAAAATAQTAFGEARNVLLGSDWAIVSQSLPHASAFAPKAISAALDSLSSPDAALTRLGGQFVPQLCLIAVIPVLGAVAYLLLPVREKPDRRPAVSPRTDGFLEPRGPQSAS